MRARGPPTTLGGLFDLARRAVAPGDAGGELRHQIPVGRGGERHPSCSATCSTAILTAPRRTGTSATLPASSPAYSGPAGSLYAIADTYPALGDGGVHLQPRERLAAALERREMPAGGMIVSCPPRTPRASARVPPRWGWGARLGQRHRARRGERVNARRDERVNARRDERVTPAELVTLACCDLGAIVRGRALPRGDLDAHLAARRQLGPGEPRFDAARPAGRSRARSIPPAICACCPTSTPACAWSGVDDASALELVLCDIVETDGTPWECCPRRFLHDALDELDAGARGATALQLRARVPAAARARPRSLAGGAGVLAGRTAARRTIPFKRDRGLDGSRPRGGALHRRVRRSSVRDPAGPGGRDGGRRSRGAAQGGRARGRPPGRQGARASRRCSTRRRRATGCTSISACWTRVAARCSTTPSRPGQPERARRALRRRDTAPRARVERLERRRARSPARACSRTAGAPGRYAWRSVTARRCCAFRRW